MGCDPFLSRLVSHVRINGVVATANEFGELHQDIAASEERVDFAGVVYFSHANVASTGRAENYTDLNAPVHGGHVEAPTGCLRA